MTSSLPTSIEDLAQRYGAAWSARDLDAIMALHAPDSSFKVNLTGGYDVTGNDAVRAAFAGILAAIPDQRFGDFWYGGWRK